MMLYYIILYYTLLVLLPPPRQSTKESNMKVERWLRKSTHTKSISSVTGLSTEDILRYSKNKMELLAAGRRV